MTSSKFMVFKDRKRELLQRRDLRVPDGRSLYEYRLTEEEFHELEELLRTWLGKLIGSFRLGQVLSLTGFPALFVLYASEWWQRRYDGSGFSWEPILRDLGVDPDSWTPSERSQCVQEGLAAWRLRPREHGALRFLGSVAVQGGLPLRLLGKDRGGIGRLLSRVLQLAEEGEVARTEIKGWIETLQQWLPKSYRQDIVYELLTELVLAALKLRQEAGLSSGDDAVAVLDRKVPDWKDRFPLSMEDQHARRLVERLVRDAANIRIRKVKPCLPVVRTLEQQDSGQWFLVSRVELPDTLSYTDLSRVFGIDDENCLPRTATLSLIVGDKIASTQLRTLAGRSAYRIEPAEFVFVNEAAGDEHLLQLSAPDGRSWMAEAPKGESLDEDLLWVFSVSSPYELLKQGGGRIGDSEVLLAIPRQWRCGSDEDGGCEAKGTLLPWQRGLYQVRGITTIDASEGKKSFLRTGRDDTSDHHFTWHGNRFWLDFLQPRRAYKGMPRLYQVDDDGTRRPVQGRPVCRVIGNTASTETLGPVILQYPSQEDVQIRTRMLLLPEQASLEYVGSDANGGEIRFSGWGISTARVIEPPMIQQDCTKSGGVISLNVTVGSGTRSPEWMTVEILWPHTTSAARIKLPFPAAGVRLFDGAGKELQPDQQIALKDLSGMRLVLKRGGTPTRRLTLNLESVSNHLRRQYPLRMLPGALSIDIALIDYETDIQHLLSLDDSPDSEVMISITSSDAHELFRFRVTRYAAVLEKDIEQLSLTRRGFERFDLESLGHLQVLTTRLEYPADDPVELQPLQSEGVPTGRWIFDPDIREPGTWLVYPSPDSDILFRPCLWPIAGLDAFASGDELLDAIAIPQQSEREDRIAEVIQVMAADFQHKSWKTVEQIARQFSHLPLATLDLWRMFTHSANGMAAMAFRLGDLPNNFYLRFGKEMPFAWETVTLSAWKQAMGQLEKQCRDIYGESADTIFQTHLEKCLSTLRAESGALSFLLGMAGADFNEQEKRDLRALEVFVALSAATDLFEGENSKLMVLRRTHAEDEWPTELSEILEQARNEPGIREFLYNDPNEYRNGVINMPLVAAAAALLDRTDQFFSTPKSIHALRTAKAFDIQWFDEAYNLTVARYLAEGACDD